MSYTGGYQCRTSLRCPHNICTRSVYCNLLCFLRVPSLILILSIRRALFSGSKAGKGLRNKGHMFFMHIMTKINFCYHVRVQAIWFLIVWQIDNFLSRTCPNIAQCTIWNRIALLHTCLVSQLRRLFFRTILHFLFIFIFIFNLFHVDNNNRIHILAYL